MALGMNRMAAPTPDIRGLRIQMEPLFGRVFSDDLEHAYSYVDQLCLHLCFRVARECQLFKFPAASLGLLVARANVAPDAVYLVQAIIDVLCEEGFLGRTTAGFLVVRQCPPDESDWLQRRARAACSEATPIYELIGRCHEHAVEFVTGRKTGLAVVFERGDMDLWKRVHTIDSVMSIYADLVAPIVEAIARPGLRVLEVGGGVGAVLQRCLSIFDRLQLDHFCFTDLGQSFVQNARRAYGGDRRLSFARVDLDLPLRDQGLVRESFDVVVAVNVLHAVKHLPFSLRELLGVLKPRGQLILSEGSPPSRARRWRLDLVFGFLRGWWDISTQPGWRPYPGFLLPRQWKGALVACGYEHVHRLPGEDWFHGPCRGGAVLARKQDQPH